MSNFEISKLVSLVLRHKPEELNLTMDKFWWVNTIALVNRLKYRFHDFNMEKLITLVEESDKQRFSFNESFTKIRANQWHSIPVDLGLVSITPPDFLYHWTAQSNLNSIMDKWLLKMERNYVHLSSDITTANSIWKRYWRPVILKVNSRIMHDEWYLFYQSQNWIWLTEEVNSNFIEIER